MEETHDWFRKEGSFQASLAALPLLRQAGIATAIMTTVSERNIAEVPDIYRTAITHQADVFAFARYCPPGFANDLPAELYGNMLKECHALAEANSDSDTWLSRKDHLWTLPDREEGRFAIPEDAEEDMIYDGRNLRITGMVPWLSSRCSQP